MEKHPSALYLTHLGGVFQHRHYCVRASFIRVCCYHTAVVAGLEVGIRG